MFGIISKITMFTVTMACIFALSLAATSSAQANVESSTIKNTPANGHGHGGGYGGGGRGYGGYGGGCGCGW